MPPPQTALSTLKMVEVFVHFEHGDSADPFPSEGPFHLKPHKYLHLMTSTLSQQHVNQFRTWIFSVSIFGKIARLFRYDRSGFQVTDGIDYSAEEGNRLLTEFFLRLDRMADDPEARGRDPTVSDATEEEVGTFSRVVKAICEPGPQPGRRTMHGQKKKAEIGLWVHPGFRNLIGSVGDPNDYPRKKVTVMEGQVLRNYIIGRPAYSSGVIVGRATRGYVAMSAETKDLVFLKETWRHDIATLASGDHLYKLLSSKRPRGVTKNIAAYAHGSDVHATKQIVRCPDMKQRTIAHLHAKDLGFEEARGYIHYRMIQSELYIQLEYFGDSKHLTSIMLDIAQGALFGFTNANSQQLTLVHST